jgi:serine/threonine protein phosphatase PrpC
MNFNFNSNTHVGLVRKANEDSYGNHKTAHGDLFVVCDGMGGHVGGATASQLAVKSIIEHIANNKSTNYHQLIYDALVFANEQVYANSVVNPELKGMGTTAVVVLISKDSGLVYYGHVGDSRLYLLRDSQIKRVTKDHSFVQLLVDQGEITEDQMETHPNKNQILKAIGTDETVKPEVCKEPMQMKDKDILLLCSDGLCGMVDDKNIKRITYGNISNLENTVNLLIEEANKNGGKDNTTATLITFGQPQNQDIKIDAPVKKSNNKKNLMLAAMGISILVLAAAIFFLRQKPNAKEQTYCDCYTELSSNINKEKSDSIKLEIYNNEFKSCDEKKKNGDKACAEQKYLSSTIDFIKDSEATRLGKENGGKDDEGKDGKVSNEVKPVDMNKKDNPTTAKKDDNNITTKEEVKKANPDCGAKIPYKPEKNEGIISIVKKHIFKCPGISDESVKTDLNNEQPQFDVEFKITCLCKNSQK